MEQKPNRTCPKCGSAEYQFRSRKTIPAAPKKGEPEATETKYRCKQCGHELRVKVAKEEVWRCDRDGLLQ
jgi:DNA-directed RNA polymerase subunit RPC12/RpoP